MSEGAVASASAHVSESLIKSLGLRIPQLAVSRDPPLRPWVRTVGARGNLVYPLPNYAMWRGNHWRYRYNVATTSTWGEGETRHMYHQHYGHAKDPLDYGRAGREFEHLSVKKGKLWKKPIPPPGQQYVAANSKPTWVWKSWHGAMNSSDMWQREVQYPEHVPEHLGAKRPLAVVSPSTFHQHMHLVHMEKLTVTVCPFLFGFGNHMMKTVLDFYRRTLSARSPFPNDKIFLFYAIDFITPVIEVTWLDGTTYRPPIFESSTAQDLIQMVMEQSWLAADRMEAAGRVLQPIAVDDYKWEQLITFKKIRDKEASKSKGAKK